MNKKLISSLFMDLSFVRGLERQSRQINLDLRKELKTRNLKRVLVVGPCISPYFYQLANTIEDSSFVALDIDKNCLDLTRSVIDIVNPSEVIKKIVESYDLSSIEKFNLINYMESQIEYAKYIMTNAVYCSVENPRNLSPRVIFVHGDVSYLPLHGMDAILMFNTTRYLDSDQLCRSFKYIDETLFKDGFFAFSGPIDSLDISFWRGFKKDKYHLIALKDSKNNINKVSLKKIIPESLSWKVTRSEKYYCIYGEKI